MSIDEILAQCLADIERGATLDDCLARYPQAAGELQPLLLLALQLRAAPPPSLSEDAFARGRRQMQGLAHFVIQVNLRVVQAKPLTG